MNLQTKLQLKLRSTIAEQDTREQIKEFACTAIRSLQELTHP